MVSSKSVKIESSPRLSVSLPIRFHLETGIAIEIKIEASPGHQNEVDFDADTNSNLMNV